MKHFFTLTFICSFTLAKTQTVAFASDSKVIKDIQGSTTLFMQIGDTTFDNAVKRAVAKYWIITDYDFFDYKEFKNKVTDSSFNFFVPMEYGSLVSSIGFTQGGSLGANPSGTYTSIRKGMMIMRGGKKESEITDWDAQIFVPLNKYGMEVDFKYAAYRMDYIIKGMNDAFILAKASDYHGSKFKVPEQSMDALNEKNAQKIAEKTLVVNIEEKNTYKNKPLVKESVFKKAKYPYRVKFVNDKEFKQILSGEDPQYVCLVPCIEYNKHILIYEPATKKTIYYGWHMQGQKVKKGDIKKLKKGKT